MGVRRFRLKPGALVAASVAVLFSQSPAWANPTGPQVVNGTVAISQPGAGILNITNTPGSIINWQGFSIGAGEVTRFIQQSAASSVLNRVVGGNVSQIYGQLLSNGRVFLVNPAGLIVGPGAIVDTAGFVGSTLNMLDGDFLAGKLRFQADPGGSGSIVNQGWIRTGYGGQVILVAPSIENSGLIHTPGGELILAAGQRVTIGSLDAEGVQFEIQAPTDSVVNVGKLLADGGAVGVFAGTLRHTGDIRANALVYDEAGSVVLKAQNEIQLAAGSSVSADGKTGGSITVESGGLARIAGSVSASGSEGRGGSISILGDRVALVESAALNASGSTGGGQVLVGGDYQGANPAIRNSTNTFVGPDASIRADATQSGDGGRVIVWSDDKTQVYGSVSAQGGPQGGNGGFAEISGKQGLVFQGSASLGAAQGTPGTLLLDPLDLYVFAGGGIDLASINELTEFPSNAATVSPATLAAAGASVVLQASRYMRITDPIALTAAGAGLTATVNTYTAPASPDPLSLSFAASNQLELNAGITTVGGAVALSAPTIQRVSSAPALTIATGGGAIGLTAGQISGNSLSLDAGSGAVTTTATGGSITLASILGSTFTANATGSISATGVTTTGNVNAASSGTGTVGLGTVNAGSGAISLSGGFLTGTLATTGAVALTSNSSSINATVNGASSLTATAPFGISIGSTTDINVANVTAGTTSLAQLSTTGGSIRGTTAASTVKGLDVSLLTSAGTGGGIGTAGTALNVDVQRGFTFRTNGDFNILLTGTGPNLLNAQFTPAASGTYSGTLTKQGGGLTLNASADTSTVTLSSLNITSGFDQPVFFGNPSVSISTQNGANLVATSVNVPTGDLVPTGGGHTEASFPVSLSAAGNLTVNSYTRAGGGLAKQTSFSAGGTMTLGTVDASKDTVSAFSSNGILIGSLITTGGVTLNAGSGAVNALVDSAALEVSAGGALTISATGIGTTGVALNPFDVAASSVTLNSTGVIGGVGAVTANTQNLTISPASTFNVSTGATSLTNLTVNNANPFAVGLSGTARVTTASTDIYNFVSDGTNFTWTPPVSTGRNVSFTSTSGNINLGAADLGTGTLSVTASGGGIATGGASIISAGAVTLNAATTINMGAVTPGNITSTGAIALHGRTGVTTGAINTSGALSIDGCFFFCGSPPISTGAITAGGVTMSTGSTISVSSVTATDNVSLQAGGALTLGGAIVTADGKTVTLSAGGGSPFQFTQIDAGATGTVSITSANGIQQTADGGSNGITAKTVSLLASNGPITNTADVTNSRLDLVGTTQLTIDTGAAAKFDAHGSTLTDLSITKRALPGTAAFELFGLGGGQSVSIVQATDPFTLSASSGTPLNLTVNQLFGTTDISIISGISTGGGSLNLSSTGGINAPGAISTGAGSATLSANGGSVNTSGGITTTGGAVTLRATGNVTTGAISTAGGNISVNPVPSTCSAPPCNVNVSGALNAGAGTVTVITANGDITGAGAITGSTAALTTANGEINLAGTITAPTVTLTAARTSAVGNNGLVTATLASTTNLSLWGEFGFNVASDTGFNTLSVSTKGTSTGAVSLTATGQTYNFARPATDLFGTSVSGTAFEVVSVNAPSTTATFRAIDGMLLVRGDGTNKLNVANLTLASTNAGDVVLQGNAANPLTLSQPTQTFDAGTGDLLVTGQVTIAGATQTFRTSGGTSTMVFQAGSAAGEKIAVTSTTDQFVQTTSSSVDAFKLIGGSGADASVAFSHSGTGAQTFQMQSGALTVAGGSGTNSFAKLEETGTSTQRICFLTFFSCNPILTLNVLGGSETGAFAHLTSVGAQQIGVSGTAANTGTTVKAGTGSGADALVQAGTSQILSNNGRLQVEGQGGPGAVAKAEILAGTFQDIDASSILVKAGASDGSLARIVAAGSQQVSANAGTLSLIAQGTEAAPLANASAIIEGQNQFIFASGGITVNGGSGTASGTTSDALIRNTGGGQQVFSSGAIVLDGGHQFSTTGIINAGTGQQTITAGAAGITLRSDTDFAGTPHVDAVVAIQNQPATLQDLSTSGPLKLSNNGGGTVGVTSGASQDIDAQYVEVLNGFSTEAGPNSATISAATTQRIFTTNTAASGFASMRVAALGTGVASVTAGTVQLIELDYPAQVQFANRDGRLIIGDVNAAGTSRVRAGDPLVASPLGNQTIFAKSITVQSGAINSLSELKATGTQVISTLQGGIDVLGGSGDNSLAQIDPILQTILSNGTISVIAGSGVNANAQIIAGSGTTLNGQTILTTNGDIILEAGGASGTSPSSAFITNTGSSSFIGTSGEIFLTAGTVSGADAIINVGNGPGVLTVTCGAGCSLPPVGTSPTGGILANSSGSPGSSTSPLLDVTSTILPLQQNVTDTLIEIAPATAAEDPTLIRRVPTCR